MRISPRAYILAILIIVVFAPLGWFIFQTLSARQEESLEVVVENTSLPTPFAEESWIRIDLPADATQLERGKEIYRLVCSACHAYDGTGLTDEWRATWGEDDQNCWQSKCHALNHPPDGFFLPQVPSIVGPIIPALFETAQDLYIYNQYQMPWHNPNRLTVDEAYAVTAYVLVLNQMDPGPILNAETAPKLSLRP